MLNSNPAEFVDAFFEAADFFLRFRGNDLQFFFVNADAGGLHSRENRRQRQIDFFVEFGEALLFDFGAKDGCERAAGNRRARRARRKACDSNAEAPLRETR